MKIQIKVRCDSLAALLHVSAAQSTDTSTDVLSQLSSAYCADPSHPSHDARLETMETKHQIHIITASELGVYDPAQQPWRLASGELHRRLCNLAEADAHWDSCCCKASTSWIESLTLLDALSNRYQFWVLELVLEVWGPQSLSKMSPRGPNSWAVHCLLRMGAAEAVCAGSVGVTQMLCSVASISVPMLCFLSARAECSQQGLECDPLQL